MAPDAMTPEKWATVERLMRKLESERPGISWTLDRYVDGRGGTSGKLMEFTGGWDGKSERHGKVVFEFDSNDELIDKLTHYAGE